MSDESMRDWPERLRLNAASCVLAKQIYQATAAVYRPDALPFEDLLPRLKDRYIQQAQALIQFGWTESRRESSARSLQSALERTI